MKQKKQHIIAKYLIEYLPTNFLEIAKFAFFKNGDKAISIPICKWMTILLSLPSHWTYKNVTSQRDLW